MTNPDIPSNEIERLNKLSSYNILDTLSESVYDDLTKIASIICDTPISTITLIDSDRQFFKSKIGLQETETPRELAFCAHAINLPQELMIVTDSRKDLRFADNPLVTGSPNVIFYAGMPLVTSDGYALGTICVIDNKPKELSENQQAALKSLANQVIQLFELREKNILLKKSEQKLSMHAKEMEVFAYAASHDLKEPLRMIKSFLKLLQKKYASILNDTTANQYIHLSVDGAERMEVLINDLLEYSRAVELDSSIEETAIEEIIEDVKQLLKLVIFEKDVKIVTSQLPVLKISRPAIRQVFQNIISNGIKYQAEGVKPVLYINALETTTHWQFSIKDNGIGIAKHNLENIFVIFKRLHKKEEFPGTGLGLALCKKIAEHYGGTIWVESEEGKGSTFYFTIEK